MKNYKNKHIIIILLSSVIIIMQFIPNNTYIELVFSIVWCAVLSLFSGKYEKSDELTRLNLGKANGITLFATIGALVIFGLIAQNMTKPLHCYTYFYISLGAVILRSILFLWFDRTPKENAED